MCTALGKQRGPQRRRRRWCVRGERSASADIWHVIVAFAASRPRKKVRHLDEAHRCSGAAHRARRGRLQQVGTCKTRHDGQDRASGNVRAHHGPIARGQMNMTRPEDPDEPDTCEPAISISDYPTQPTFPSPSPSQPSEVPDVQSSQHAGRAHGNPWTSRGPPARQLTDRQGAAVPEADASAMALHSFLELLGPARKPDDDVWSATTMESRRRRRQWQWQWTRPGVRRSPVAVLATRVGVCGLRCPTQVLCLDRCWSPPCPPMPSIPRTSAPTVVVAGFASSSSCPRSNGDLTAGRMREGEGEVLVRLGS